MVKSMKKRQYKKSTKHSRKSPKRGKKSYKKHSVKNLKRGHKNSKKIALHRRKSRGRVRHGGSCGCGVMKGGMVSSPAAGPVGYSWDGGNEASWPGAAASQGLDTQGAAMSNHFKVSPNGIVVGGIDPYAGSSGMVGGKKRKGKGKRKGQKGGFFQEIVNLGRGAQYGVNGGYFNLVGKQQPISQNPFPTQEQPIDSDYKFIGATPPNVRSMYVNANNQVAGV
jgi:hypothetical protein